MLQPEFLPTVSGAAVCRLIATRRRRSQIKRFETPQNILLCRDCIRHSLHSLITASHGSQSPTSTNENESLSSILSKTQTVGNVLFNANVTSRTQPPPVPHFTVYNNQDQSTSSSTKDNSRTSGVMDGKRHPSSFQQLEKLGEGTYATVRLAYHAARQHRIYTDFQLRSSKAGIGKPASWWH